MLSSVVSFDVILVHEASRLTGEVFIFHQQIEWLSSVVGFFCAVSGTQRNHTIIECTHLSILN